ncbi:MAG: type II toxin-antitoxin system Phd/YefM family antitoxin [Anaerolineales bacterium]|nr:type II toxin-antitoxin system Phd/YefM family antitoxin [Anaerolineales bacterium]
MDISIADAHNRLSALLKQVQKGPVTITRRGQAVGVLISPEEYESLRQVKAYLQMLTLSHELRESAGAAELYCASRQELEGEA